MFTLLNDNTHFYHHAPLPALLLGGRRDCTISPVELDATAGAVDGRGRTAFTLPFLVEALLPA